MASFRGSTIATVFVLLVLLAFCEARPAVTMHKSKAPANHRIHTATVTPQGIAGACSARDINIQEFETSGVGIPIWEVQFINLCTDPRCVISQVIVQCGQFHSPTLVNPNVFRRLDSKAGTCIVNNGDPIPSSNTITFQYSEIWNQPITLKSAHVVCSG